VACGFLSHFLNPDLLGTIRISPLHTLSTFPLSFLETAPPPSSSFSSTFHTFYAPQEEDPKLNFSTPYYPLPVIPLPSSPSRLVPPFSPTLPLEFKNSSLCRMDPQPLPNTDNFRLATSLRDWLTSSFKLSSLVFSPPLQFPPDYASRAWGYGTFPTDSFLSSMHSCPWMPDAETQPPAPFMQLNPFSDTAHV